MHIATSMRAVMELICCTSKDMQGANAIQWAWAIAKQGVIDGEGEEWVLSYSYKMY